MNDDESVPDPPPVLTLSEVQSMLGAKDIELYRVRTLADTLLSRKDAEIRALRQELDRLHGPRPHGLIGLPGLPTDRT